MSHSEHSSDVEEEYTTEDVSVPTDPSCLDLSSLFAPVSRTDLEVLLVKLIMKHQEEAGWIVEACRKPVNSLEISHEVTDILVETSLSVVQHELTPFIERSAAYLTDHHVRNALAILEAVTGPTVDWTVEQAENLQEADDKSALEAMWTSIEESWQSALKQCELVASEEGAKPSGIAQPVQISRTTQGDKAALATRRHLTRSQVAYHEFTYYLTALTEWRKKLTNIVGPVFSDPIREGNKKKNNTNGNAAGKDEAAASSSSSSSKSSSSSSSSSSASKRKSTAADSTSNASDSWSAAAVTTASGSKSSDSSDRPVSKKCKH